MECSFEPIDFFILRTPILTIGDYNEICNNDFDYIYNKFFSKNPIVQEGIYLGSPILYYNLTSINSKKGNIKKFNKVKRSFYKYLIRMSTRSTPFGLFAGISDHVYSSNTKIEMYENKYVNKRMKLNTKWILKLILELEKDFNVINHLKIVRNPDVSKGNNEYILPFKTFYGQNNNNENQFFKIPRSSILDYIYSLLENQIEVNELSKHLDEKFKISNEQSIKILQSLLKDEFIISNLKPTDINKEPLSHIINILHDIEPSCYIVEKLISIERLILKYCELPLGEGLETLKTILSLMRSLINIKAKTLLQVDTKFKYKYDQLNKAVAYDFAKGVEILYKVAANDNSYTPLKRFYIDFIRKYGRDREVPLIELIDEEVGIGLSNLYNIYQNISKESRNEDTWMGLIAQSLLKNKDIHLEEYDLQNMFELENLNIPESVDVLGEIISPSHTDVDKGQYTIVLSSMKTLDSMGRYGSRFYNMFDKEKFEYLKEMYTEVQRGFFPNELILEPKFITPTGFTSNLVSEGSLLPHSVTVGIVNQNNNKCFNLSDILIGVENEGFYIKSLSTKERLIIKSFDMVSRKFYPTPIRFLLDISQGDIRIQRPYELASLQNIDYIPRISFRNIILFPATWLFKTSHTNNLEDHEMLDKFIKWKNDYKVPNLVYIGSSDQKLLINLSKKEFLIEIVRIIKIDREIRFFELVGDLNDRWINKKGECVFSEVVFSLKNNSFYRNKNVINKLEYQSIEKDDRYKIPGSEWFYIKVYSPKNKQNDILKDHLYPFIMKNLESKVMKKFFYMRYKDKYHHLRIRFEIEEEKRDCFFKEIIQLFNELNFLYYIERITIDTYEREIERYGEVNLIGHAEEIFFIDSLISLELLENKDNIIPQEFIYMLSILGIVNSFLSTSEEKIHFLKKYKNHSTNKVWRFLKMNFEKYTFDYELEKGKRKSNFDNIEYFNEIINKYRHFINNELVDKELTNVHERILHSLIHMHLNRLIGLERELENEILSLSYQYFFQDFYSRSN
nr:lantibiotic dehydratase [Cytobacillus kochii]